MANNLNVKTKKRRKLWQEPPKSDLYVYNSVKNKNTSGQKEASISRIMKAILTYLLIWF